MEQQQTAPKAEVFDLIALKKTHLMIYIAAAIFTPIGSGFAAYFSAIRGLDKESIARQLIEVRFETEQKFAKKEDYKILGDKIDGLTKEVANLTGMLKQFDFNKR
jgi:hypothetical protein